jgi:orotate phosphoribosyltransferase
VLKETEGASGIVEMMEASGALLSGHFELASGLHSGRYIQCALLLEDPGRAERVGRMLASVLRRTIGDEPEMLIVSPALGGMIIGHEVARALGTRHIFAERTGGRMSLRRGFRIERGERVVVVEDVTTTGGSIKEVMEVVSVAGGTVVGVGLIVNRARDLDLGVPVAFLLRGEIENHEPGDCPLCRSGVELVKPGTKRTQAEVDG